MNHGSVTMPQMRRMQTGLFIRRTEFFETFQHGKIVGQSHVAESAVQIAPGAIHENMPADFSCQHSESAFRENIGVMCNQNPVFSMFNPVKQCLLGGNVICFKSQNFQLKFRNFRNISRMQFMQIHEFRGRIFQQTPQNFGIAVDVQRMSPVFQFVKIVNEKMVNMTVGEKQMFQQIAAQSEPVILHLCIRTEIETDRLSDGISRAAPYVLAAMCPGISADRTAAEIFRDGG